MVEFGDECFHLTCIPDGCAQGFPINGIHDHIIPLHPAFNILPDTPCAVEVPQSVPNLPGDRDPGFPPLARRRVGRNSVKLGMVPPYTWDFGCLVVGTPLKTCCQLVRLNVEPC
jgi:hypothetical protein